MQFPYRIIFIIGIGLNALAYILALKEKEEEFIYPYGHNKINSEDVMEVLSKVKMKE